MGFNSAFKGLISKRSTSTAHGAVTRLATDEYGKGKRVLLMELLRGWPRMNIGTEYEYCWWHCYKVGHGWILERKTSTADGTVNQTGSVVQDSERVSKDEKIKLSFGCYPAFTMISKFYKIVLLKNYNVRKVFAVETFRCFPNIWHFVIKGLVFMTPHFDHCSYKPAGSFLGGKVTIGEYYLERYLTVGSWGAHMTVVRTETEQCSSIVVILTRAFQTFSSMEPFSILKYFTQSHLFFWVGNIPE